MATTSSKQAASASRLGFFAFAHSKFRVSSSPPRGRARLGHRGALPPGRAVHESSHAAVCPSGPAWDAAARRQEGGHCCGACQRAASNYRSLLKDGRLKQCRTSTLSRVASHLEQRFGELDPASAAPLILADASAPAWVACGGLRSGGQAIARCGSVVHHHPCRQCYATWRTHSVMRPLDHSTVHPVCNVLLK